MINGFVIINKKKGISSAKIVAIVKHLLYARDKNVKLGHMGTLDPDGEGVLPIAIGNATKLFSYLSDKKKTYYTEFQFGILTDTLDISGQVIKNDGKIPTLYELNQIIPKFIGKYNQIPPLYSAKCYKGKRGYDLAREGANVSLEGKDIEIYEINDVQEKGNGLFSMVVTCSGGTYIRSLARDIGEALGTFGTMTYINRLKSGCFEIEDSVSLKELEASPNLIFSKILPMDLALKGLPEVKITRDREIALLRGFSTTTDIKDCNLVKISCLNEIIALGDVEDHQAKVKTFLKSRANRPDAKIGIALGFFDGLHIGHKKVIDEGLRLADKGTLYVSFFSDSTLNFIKKDKNTLFTEKQRKDILCASNTIPLDLPTDEKFFKNTPQEFLEYIYNTLLPDFIVCGSDFRFGINAQGNTDHVKAFCSCHNIIFCEVPLLKHDDNIVSTSKIKSMIQNGQVENANKILFSPYMIEGYSEHGRECGREIGFPTLNLKLAQNIFLKHGVYSAKVEIDNNIYNAVVNIGTAPTFSYDVPKIEIHLIDANIENKKFYVKLFPQKYLREIKKFSSIENLQKQIKKDIEEAIND